MRIRVGGGRDDLDGFGGLVGCYDLRAESGGCGFGSYRLIRELGLCCLRRCLEGYCSK